MEKYTQQENPNNFSYVLLIAGLLLVAVNVFWLFKNNKETDALLRNWKEYTEIRKQRDHIERMDGFLNSQLLMKKATMDLIRKSDSNDERLKIKAIYDGYMIYTDTITDRFKETGVIESVIK